MKFLILIIMVPQLYFAGIEKGIANTSVIFVAILLASLVSRTTKTSELVNVIHRITKSNSFALLIALSLNAIPQVEAMAKAIVEAGKARGVRISPYRQLISLFVVSLRSADQQAEALVARGVRV
jgi:biotin transport system permease protein